MIHKETHKVTAENGPRPAGSPDECFCCKQPLMSQHRDDCVLRKRTVVVKMTIEYVIEVPEHWTKNNVEFHRNEGSWCASNAIKELKSLNARCSCICPHTQYEFLREATMEDEENDRWGELEENKDV